MMLFNVPILPAENDLTHLGWKLKEPVKNKKNIRYMNYLICLHLCVKNLINTLFNLLIWSHLWTCLRVSVGGR